MLEVLKNNSNKIIAMSALGAGMLLASSLGVGASEYVSFSGGVLTPTSAGVLAGTNAVEKGIATAFGIIAFLSILALAFGGKFILNFLVSLPGKVFGGTGGSK